LIVHGGGVALYLKDGPYEAELAALLSKGVILAQCENTLRERKIGKEQLWPFVSFVPSANGELIIRQADGWAYIHP
jgi:intracellular sulfur oxidation DsrE/DsrF family protein